MIETGRTRPQGESYVSRNRQEMRVRQEQTTRQVVSAGRGLERPFAAWFPLIILVASLCVGIADSQTAAAPQVARPADEPRSGSVESRSTTGQSPPQDDSDSRLLAQLTQLIETGDRPWVAGGNVPQLDQYLHEILQRDRETFEQPLQKLVAKLNRQRDEAFKLLGYDRQHRDRLPGEAGQEPVEWTDAHDAAVNTIARVTANLELVTVLRRLQQRPDPVQVIVHEFDPDDLQWPQLPVLRVSVRNMDTLQQETGFQAGGDYRSGRWARWRIHIRNRVTGQLMKVLPAPSFIGGGLVVVENRPTLMYGEGWNTRLRVADYVASLDPGDYTLQVLYHNVANIADMADVEGLICCRSRQIPFSVGERVVWIDRKEQVSIRSQLAKLDRSAHVRMVRGEYGPWAYEVVPPDSELGRLLSQGWNAVPELLRELNDPQQPDQARVHTLALLYSITGLVDPRSDGSHARRLWPAAESAIGPYEWLSPGWAVWGHRDGRGGGGGMGSGHHQRVGLPKPNADSGEPPGKSPPVVKVDRRRVAELTAEWKKLSRRIKVRDLREAAAENPFE